MVQNYVNFNLKKKKMKTQTFLSTKQEATQKKPTEKWENCRITSVAIVEIVDIFVHIDGFPRPLDGLNSQIAPRFQVNYGSAIGHRHDP